MDGLLTDPETLACSLMCLPSEILALCLAWLPLRDRISISPVSRYWRSISLAHPTIWADIDLTGHYEGLHEILRMALSRTGTCPVSITGPYKLDPERVVFRCLREHLHHIRRIVLDLPEDALPLHTPAPLLEELVSTSYHIDIPVDFLGGGPARLQTLDLASVSLPTICPAISTVTNLTLDGPTSQTHAATYGRLFDLCPRLIALSLHDLDVAFRNLLPRGPAPRSLRKLFLSTEHRGYNLISHYLDWRTDSLRDVHLQQESSPLAYLSRFVAGSTRLRMAAHHVFKTTQLTARDAAGRVHGIRFSHTANDAGDVLDLISHNKDALRALARLEVPLAALETFLPVLGASPELAHVVLLIPVVPFLPNGASAHNIPQKMPPGLLRVKERCNALRAIVLHLVCSDERCPPTPDEAHGLAKHVLALGQCGGLPRELVVRGSTGDVFDETVDFEEPARKDSAFSFSFQCPQVFPSVGSREYNVRIDWPALTQYPTSRKSRNSDCDQYQPCARIPPCATAPRCDLRRLPFPRSHPRVSLGRPSMLASGPACQPHAPISDCALAVVEIHRAVADGIAMGFMSSRRYCLHIPSRRRCTPPPGQRVLPDLEQPVGRKMGLRREG